MVSALDVFNAALALMDELSDNGSTRNGVGDYAARSPAILESLVCEFLTLDGSPSSPSVPIESLDDSLLYVPDRYARGTLPYGLAAHLLADENPAAASFLQQRYEELRDRSALRRPAQLGPVVDLYGSNEFGQFGRW